MQPVHICDKKQKRVHHFLVIIFSDPRSLRRRYVQDVLLLSFEKENEDGRRRADEDAGSDLPTDRPGCNRWARINERS